jgi:putative ABC transport system substrate-binding protein
VRRREFIALGSAAVAWPIGVRAQALPIVGFLGSDSPELYTDRLRAFRRGLKDAGYIESDNVAIALGLDGLPPPEDARTVFRDEAA